MNLLQITFDYGEVNNMDGYLNIGNTKTLWGTGSVETIDDLFLINNDLCKIVVIAGSWFSNQTQKFVDKNYYIIRDPNYKDKFYYHKFVGSQNDKIAELWLIKYNEYIINKTLQTIFSINKNRKNTGYDEIKFDAILTPTSWFTIIASLNLSQILGIPLISTLHVNEEELQKISEFKLPRSNIVLKYDRLTKQKSDFLIAKNQQIMNTIIPLNKNVIEINNDIIVGKELHDSDRKHDVVYVGRLSFEKGIDRLFKIAKILNTKGIALHICGESLGLDPKVNAIINNMKLLDNVYFHGFLDKDKLYHLLHSSKIIILPSRTEVYNQAILEGAILGCIPISTDVGVAKDVVFETKNIITGINENDLVNNFIQRILLELTSPTVKHKKIMELYAGFGGNKNRIKRFNYIKSIVQG